MKRLLIIGMLLSSINLFASSHNGCNGNFLDSLDLSKTQTEQIALIRKEAKLKHMKLNTELHQQTKKLILAILNTKQRAKFLKHHKDKKHSCQHGKTSCNSQDSNSEHKSCASQKHSCHKKSYNCKTKE